MCHKIAQTGSMETKPAAPCRIVLPKVQESDTTGDATSNLAGTQKNFIVLITAIKNHEGFDTFMVGRRIKGLLILLLISRFLFLCHC